jgi:hypothetical protein
MQIKEWDNRKDKKEVENLKENNTEEKNINKDLYEFYEEDK